MKIFEIEPIYCQYIPQDLELGKIYISKDFNTATHLCACGCGKKVITPFNDSRQWSLTDINNKITLKPSIGNWSGERPYHAHYFITENKIHWL